jgi:thiamine kinase-like enzyme
VFVLFSLSSCRKPFIDENYAAEVVKNKLSLSGSVTAKKLSGGFGDTINFIADDGLKKYVIRFMKNKSQCELETYNFKVASDCGYGPHVYHADSSQCFLIMEFLSGKKISYSDLQSEEIYKKLAHLLQKIHKGPVVKDSGFDFFKRINDVIQINKLDYCKYVPLEKIENIMKVIHRTLLPFITLAPCHNDLHGGNLAFMESGIKAFDYGDAAQGDPYFDVATVVQIFCSFKKVNEDILFSTYLGRQPSDFDKAKLYLIKQIVLIKWACDSLCRLKNSPEVIRKYGLIKAPSFVEFLRNLFAGKVDFSKPEDSLSQLKTLLNEVFVNFESQEFKDAVRTLNEH